MSDITREEMTARLEAMDANSEARFERSSREFDARFERLSREAEVRFEQFSREIGQIRTSSIGKTSFFFGMVALFGAIMAVTALAPAWMGTGLTIRTVVDAAARESVAQALRK